MSLFCLLQAEFLLHDGCIIVAAGDLSHFLFIIMNWVNQRFAFLLLIDGAAVEAFVVLW